MNETVIQQTLKDLNESIVSITEQGQEGHLAIKLTALIAIDIMTRMSIAQQKFTDEVLELWSNTDLLTKEKLKQNLEKYGVKAS